MSDEQDEGQKAYAKLVATEMMLSTSLTATILALSDKDAGPKSPREFMTMLDDFVKRNMEKEPGKYDEAYVRLWWKRFEVAFEEFGKLRDWFRGGEHGERWN